ncbi:MAG: hypothetical protein AB7I25_03735 [Vicinamibacterales bacterium]
MSEARPTGDRLDSWKAIAAYLQRDVATVARWEKNLGLPVHRVAGSGRSVFAYPSEIDHWLRAANPGLSPPDAAPEPAPTPGGRPVRSYFWRWMVLGAAALVLAAALAARPRTITADDLRVELTSAGVIARDSEGTERWQHLFPATHRTYVPDGPSNLVQVTGGARPAVYFATHYRERRLGAQPGEASSRSSTSRAACSERFRSPTV